MTRKKTATLEALVAQIDPRAPRSEDGLRLVHIICRFFGLPTDLTTRSSLKKIHGKLHEVYPLMEQAFEESVDLRIKLGILAIYTNMCTDAILRNRLCELGFLGQLLTLMAIPLCRNLTLDSLIIITHHAGLAVRMEIARAACEPLLQLIKDFPEDQETSDFALRVLSHVIVSVVSEEAKQKDPSLATSLPLQDVAQALIDGLRRPDPPPTLITHVTRCFTTLSQSKDIELSQSMANLFLAGLCSKEWEDRSHCLGALIHASLADAEDEAWFFHPRTARCITHISEAPKHVREPIQTWGIENAVMYKAMIAYEEFTSTLFAAHSSGGEFYNAGKKIARLILNAEVPTVDGSSPIKNTITGQSVFPGGESGTRWSDTFPRCSAAIRQNGVVGELFLADILDLEALLMRVDFSGAIALATQIVERNSDFAYGYYVLALLQFNVHGLRAAARGLECTPGPLNLTPCMRLQNLRLKGQIASIVGLGALTRNTPGKHGLPTPNAAVALLKTAKKDLQTFFEEAAPDHRYLSTVCCWLIALHVVSGDDISDDFHEIKVYRDRLEFATDLNKWLDIDSPRTQIRIVTERILRDFPAARKEWGAVVAANGCEGHNSDAVRTEAEMEHDLAAWMAGLDVDDEASCQTRTRYSGHEHRSPSQWYMHEYEVTEAADTKKPRLYHCSFCQNSSAVLRKCAGCSEARYCNATCQKRHWSVHKKKCPAGKK
ncbi:hypothetical protein MIND_00380300 [Mycena indigotica]|uniref:MYND-type domain-containing protein n=1 Tax=Mycena indigotica TaxID=2126181 RepID=A0A8H6T2X7_9AGAR|nr:uncharacterized protein MIND_00380300 [Mycena indigotica]KAF7310071.1 hypothetical protein MIND_00380300 [Mycena indigotica]